MSPKYAEISDEIIKALNLSNQPVNYIGRFIGQRNTPRMRFKLRKHVEIFVKRLGLDIKCITTAKKGKKGEVVSITIHPHDKDPFIEYRYTINYIEVEVKFE